MSDYKEIEDSSNELRKVLDEISDRFFASDFEGAIKILEGFYKENKRHLYSAISQYIIDYKDEQEKIAYLAYGISEIINNLETNACDSDFKKQLLKLYDHIQLEYIRLTSVTQKLEAQIRESRNASCELERKTTELGDKAEEIERKMEGMQKEYIAILGIFSAIVLAFVGEMAFSTSVLENMYQIERTENIIAIITMIGIVFANILFSLFNFVSYLVKGVNVISYHKIFWADFVIAIFIIILLLIAA